jgi:hypothetical protein
MRRCLKLKTFKVREGESKLGEQISGWEGGAGGRGSERACSIGFLEE